MGGGAGGGGAGGGGGFAGSTDPTQQQAQQQAYTPFPGMPSVGAMPAPPTMNMQDPGMQMLLYGPQAGQPGQQPTGWGAPSGMDPTMAALLQQQMGQQPSQQQPGMSSYLQQMDPNAGTWAQVNPATGQTTVGAGDPAFWPRTPESGWYAAPPGDLGQLTPLG